MLAQRFRFHGHNSLRFVYKNGEAVRSQLLTIKYVENPRRRHSRVAIVVSKKILKRAVGRNRIRRRVYEIIRNELPLLGNNYDIICIVSSPEVATIDHTELSAALRTLFASASLYRDTPKDGIIK